MPTPILLARANHRRLPVENALQKQLLFGQMEERLREGAILLQLRRKRT